MGAKEIEEVTSYELVPKIELGEDKRLKVSYDDKAYGIMANESGIDVDFDKLKKFNDKFLLKTAVLTGDALIEGYKAHADAVGFDMVHKTPLNTIEMKGNKNTYSHLSKTNGTGFGVTVSTEVRGMKMTVAAKRKQIFDDLGMEK